ncbi:MAG: hypothetical protein AAGI34_15750 [Pseudomonadota bacterium]
MQRGTTTPKRRAMTGALVPMLPFAPFVAPFGGAVTQTFEFWRGWFESVGQIGLVNIDLGRTESPEIEARILEEVGSYGRQIGKLSAALEAVVRASCEIDDGQGGRRLDPSRLSDDDIAAIVAFRKLLEETEAVKNREGPPR